jgi:hypothetical protein
MAARSYDDSRLPDPADLENPSSGAAARVASPAWARRQGSVEALAPRLRSPTPFVTSRPAASRAKVATSTPPRDTWCHTRSSPRAGSRRRTWSHQLPSPEERLDRAPHRVQVVPDCREVCCCREQCGNAAHLLCSLHPSPLFIRLTYLERSPLDCRTPPTMSASLKTSPAMSSWLSAAAQAGRHASGSIVLR